MKPKKLRLLKLVVVAVQELSMKFDFTVEEMNGILAILAKQPFEQVTAIIEKIRQQAVAQMQPAPTEVDKDAE
jgi:hypothetical protein